MRYGTDHPILSPRLLQKTPPTSSEGRNKRQLVQLNEQSSPSLYLSPIRKAETRTTASLQNTFHWCLLTVATEVKNILNILVGGLNSYCLAPRLPKTVT